MSNKWAIIYNKTLELYIAVTSDSGLEYLTEGEEVCKTNLTKAQALQKANTMNKILDRAKELL